MILNRTARFLGLFSAAAFLMIGCESTINSSGSADMEAISGKAKAKTAAPVSCQNAGDTGMTAAYVNRSVSNTTIDFESLDCDIAIYFDKDAPKRAVVQNVAIIQETGGNGKSTGVWNNGGNVTVTRSAFTSDFAGQYVAIRYDGGARGSIRLNEIYGTHRVGILVRGDGTAVDINGNTIAGSGAKTSGWAENGVQIDQQASAKLVNNTVTGHWWDGESNFGSSAVLVAGMGSKIANNTLRNNEFNLYLLGDGNKVTGNRTSNGIASQSSREFKSYGALISGSNNHLAGNHFTSDEGTGGAGIYIFSGAANNKVTGNRITGFEELIIDGGDDSMIRGTPAPSAGL